MELFVCAASDFPRGSRRLIKVGRRNIALYNVDGHIYALDNACYHHGGPLLNGDIEDLSGRVCVKCPWHSYCITLATGEGLYWGVDVTQQHSGGAPRPMLKSKGPKQRVHRVEERDGNLYCIVNVSNERFESDHYAEMDIANREQATPLTSSGVPATHQSSTTPIHSNRSHAFGVDVSRSGALLASLRETSSSTLTLDSATPVSADARTVTFRFRSATPLRERRNIRPGTWVTLRFPVSQSAHAQHLQRTWTVTHTYPNGFSCTVRRRDDREQKGDDDAVGSASVFLHRLATCGNTAAALSATEFELVGVGGDFTLHNILQQANTAAARRPILMLSAGIGITPLFASLHALVNDPCATVSGPPTVVIHIHSERRISSIPFADDLARLHKTFSASHTDGTDPFHYTLRILCSEVVQNSSTEPESVQHLQEEVGLCVTQGARLNGTHVVDAVRVLSESASPSSSPVHVMICGPSTYMRDARQYCIDAGVADVCIHQESFT